MLRRGETTSAREVAARELGVKAQQVGKTLSGSKGVHQNLQLKPLSSHKVGLRALVSNSNVVDQEIFCAKSYNALSCS